MFEIIEINWNFDFDFDCRIRNSGTELALKEADEPIYFLKCSKHERHIYSL
jgi:hypothetical protein